MDDRDELPGRFYDGRLFRRLLPFVRPYRGTMYAALACVLASSATTLAGPLLLRRLIDEGIGHADADVISAMAFLYLALEIARFAVEYGQSYLLQRLGQLSMRDLRMALFGHLQTLPLSFYEENRVGRIVTRTTNDVGALAELFSAGIVTLLKDGILIAGIGVALLAMHVELGLVTLSITPALAAAVLWFRRYLREAYRRVRAAVSRMNVTIQENLTGIRSIQLFCLEDQRRARFLQDSGEFRDAVLASVRTHATFQPVIQIISSAALALIFWYGGGLAMSDPEQGGITLGMLVAYIQYMPHLLTPIRDMGEKFTIFQAAFAAAERIFRVLDTPAGIAGGRGRVPLGSARGEVVLEGVRFGYRPGVEILHGIDLRIRPGECVALVGRTGAGKTTLAKLLVRLYDPWTGVIRLDGHDLRDLPLAELRRRVAVVTQDIFLFPDTVLENVRLWDPGLSREEVVEACRWTNAHTFIERLPGGYDHVLAEGGRNLSVGERQLLSFARALIRRPAVLVLDEATSSVDARTERLISEALERITRGRLSGERSPGPEAARPVEERVPPGPGRPQCRTSIIIAHRLATVKHADRVIVMEEGRILEDGPPARLLSDGGLFQRLHALQFSAREATR